MTGFDMNAWIRGSVQPQRERSAQLAARLFGTPMPERDPVPEHDHPDVAPLWRARNMALEAGDEQGVAEIEQRLRRIDKTLVPHPGSIDAAAGRGQHDRIGANPDDLVRAELRGAMIARRQEHITLGSDGRIPASDLAKLEPRGRLP